VRSEKLRMRLETVWLPWMQPHSRASSLLALHTSVMRMQEDDRRAPRWMPQAAWRALADYFQNVMNAMNGRAQGDVVPRLRNDETQRWPGLFAVPPVAELMEDFVY
jgi:hypothetical protein